LPSPTFYTMNREYVYSKIMYYFEYDENKQILTIGFNGGKVTLFYGISAVVYNNFLNSESFGRYYLEHIKSKYESKIIYKNDNELSYSLYSNFRYDLLTRFRTIYKALMLTILDSRNHSNLNKEFGKA